MLVFSYGMLAAVATFIGGIVVVLARRWTHANRDYMLAFAAGVLIGLTLLKIFPEAYRESAWAPLVATLGFFAMYLIEQLAIPHHGHQHEHAHLHEGGDHDTEMLGWLAWVGVLVHSFVDGLAISSGADVSAGMARSVTLGVVLHELPEGVLSASLLISGGMSAVRVLVLTALVGLATPAGAWVSDLLIHWLGSSVSNAATLAMALAGGTFVYVGVADMLHHAHAQQKGAFRATIAFSAGLGMFILDWFVS